MKHVRLAFVDPRGTPRTRPPCGPNSFIFMQFSAKNLQNNTLARPLWALASPPQENPGSATTWQEEGMLSDKTKNVRTKHRLPG